MKQMRTLIAVLALLVTTIPVVAAAQAVPMSSESTSQIVHWIAGQVADARQPYCYRETYGRGAGKPLSTCNKAGEEKSGLLCYPDCRAEYGGAGPVCWEHCPSEYTDTGALCTRPAATEHLTHVVATCEPHFHNTGVSCYKSSIPLKTRSLDTASCPPDMYRKGAFCYSECRPGFTNTGLTCYRGPDTIAKKSYGRGAGSPMQCKAGEDEDAALCYPPCRTGLHGVGPVCWENCPSGRKDCGLGCALSTKECVKNTASMVIAPVMLAWDIATFGTTSELSGLYKDVVDTLTLAMKAKSVVNAQDKVQATVNLWVDETSKDFDKLTRGGMSAELAAYLRDPAQLAWIKRQYALDHLHLMLTKDLEETALNGISAVSGFDPTGITGVIAAFSKPVCRANEPFPAGVH